MQPTPPTIMFLSSPHLNWIGLRVALQEWPGVRVLDDVQQATAVVPTIRKLQPNLILVDGDQAESMGLVAFVRDVHTASPTSRILVVGTTERLRHATLWMLKDLGVVSYRCWDDLCQEAVPRWITTVWEDDVLVVSRAVLDEFTASPELRRRWRTSTLILDDQERAVLMGLAAGMPQQEIAATVHISVPTVKRTVAALREKFAAPTGFVLGMKAALQGFVSIQMDDPSRS